MRMPRVLREFHERGVCTCSICRELQYAGPHSFGLLAPLDKAWNAWRWMFYVGQRGVWFVRWTGFWQQQPQWRSQR